MEDNWLQYHLVRVVRAGLCAKIHCTTCGAVEFRRGLLDSLATAMGKNTLRHLDRECAHEMLCALTKVRPESGEQHALFEEPVRCILFDLWSSGAVAESGMELQLLGSWSGEVLARMNAHYQATVAARRAFAEFNDPVNVQKRRDEAKHQRQNLHAIRLERKKERDRIWRASIQTVDP